MKNKVTTIRILKPMGSTLKNDKGLILTSPWVKLKLLMISLRTNKGPEPIKVRVPPIIAQKPIGINIRERGTSKKRQILLTIGSIKVAPPELLRKPAKQPETNDIRKRIAQDLNKIFTQKENALKSESVIEDEEEETTDETAEEPPLGGAENPAEEITEEEKPKGDNN